MRRINKDEKGIASIVVALIMVIVIGLIIFGFVEVSTTNQNEALTNQLGQRAYDAAESAINLTSKQIAADVNGGTTPPAATTCTSGVNNTYIANVGNSGNLSPDNTVSVTCLLVNTTPNNLTASPVPVGNGIVWQINPNGMAIGKILLTWTGNGTPGSPNCPEAVGGAFPTEGGYQCSIPILQVDLFQVPGSFPTSPAALNSDTITTYLIPSATANPSPNEGGLPNSFSLANAAGSTSNPRELGCTITGNTCSATITIGGAGAAPASGNGAAPADTYFVRITSMYSSATNLTLTPETATGGGINLINNQAVIDVTAKDRSVERRLQVRVGIPSKINGTTQQYVLPNNAIESYNTICKQLSVGTGAGQYADNCSGQIPGY
jgi:hypothetical protein